MELSTIAGTAATMKFAQAQQGVSTAVMKQTADQQSQMANMLAQNATQAPQPAPKSGSGYSFSTFA